MTTHKLKILLVGNFGSGKTSIINRFVDNKFSDNSLQTFSQSNPETINQKTKTLNIDSTTIAILSITDTAGEERHAKLIKNYFTDIHGALIVFDLNDQESFAQVEKWNDELIKNAPKDLVTMLVGNKSDITERKVKVQEVNTIAQKLSFESYEVSAKTGNNVALVFEKLTNKIIARIKEPGEKVMRKDSYSQDMKNEFTTNCSPLNQNIIKSTKNFNVKMKKRKSENCTKLYKSKKAEEKKNSINEVFSQQLTKSSTNNKIVLTRKSTSHIHYENKK